ncbi:MAG: M48 family metalloprotease, partial [Candidatus Micrarchaeota archaeon]|nr:M48 family metalloprotease [Candidatus Micrarchaeota archaeon]
MKDHKLAIKNGISAPILEKGPVHAIRPRLDEYGRVEKNDFVGKYGIYPDDHPLVQYIRSLEAAKKHDPSQIFVTRKWKDINAACFPDGSIFISDRLIGFCEYREELEFVLQHELTHKSKNHIENMYSEESPIRKIGVSRLNEWSADLSEMVKDDNAANPYGALMFLERLASRRDGKGGGIHGTTYERIINIEHAIRLIDMDSLDSKIAKIPSEWPMRKKKDRPGLGKDIESLSLEAVLHELGEILESNLPLGKKEELLAKACVRIEDEIKRICKGTSDSAAADLRRLFQMTLDLENRWLTGIPHEFLNSSTFLTEFPGLLSSLPESINVHIDYDSLAQLFKYAIRKNAIENNSSYEIAHNFLDCLKSYAKGRIEGERMFQNEDMVCAKLLLRKYGKSETNIKKYLDNLVKDGLSPNKREILPEIARHFALDVPSIDKLKASAYFADSKIPREAEIVRVKRAYSIQSDRQHHWEEFYVQKSEEIVRAINPKSLADFLSFLDVALQYNPTSMSPLSAGDPLLDNILKNYSGCLIGALKKHLNVGYFSKEEKILLLEKVFPLSSFDSWISTLGLNHVKLEEDDLKRIAAIAGKDCILEMSFHTLKKIEGRKEAFGFLKFLVDNGFTVGSEREIELGEDEIGIKKQEVALYIFKKFKFDMGDTEHLDQMLSATQFIDDPNLELRLQKSILKNYADLLPPEKVYGLLFKDKRVSDYAAIEAREEFLDKRVSDPKELDSIKKDVVARFENIDSEAAGSAVIVEDVTQRMLKDKPRFLKTLLTTSRSNKALREYVCEILLEANIADKLAEAGKKGEVMEPGESGIDGGMMDYKGFKISIEDYEKMIYKLDYESRFVLANWLLVGEEGVLLSKKSRVETMDWFFNEFIEKPQINGDQKVHGFLKTAFGAVAEKGDVNTLYFLLHPIIVERMLGTPKKNHEWGKALDNAKSSVMRKLPKKTSSQDRYYHGEDLEDAIFIVKSHIAESRTDKPKDATMVLELNAICENYFPARDDVVDRMSSVGFVKHLASRMGAPGVRFLQVLGIYADLTPELRREFDDVYDNVKGQMKLSAFHTLQKNWHGKSIEDELEMDQRIGGGSLVTVYDAVLDGKECVVKVVNPNIAYRSESVCNNLDEIFKTDSSLSKGLPLIENIRIWIQKDISFEGIEHVPTFIEQNNGFCVEGNDYTIRVPKHIVNSTKYIVEEKVNGMNLTMWDELGKTHDMKKIISLVVKNSVSQISNGL